MTSDDTPRPRRRRWPWLVLALALAVVGLRVALPSLLRDRLQSELSTALGRAVHVGRVRLGLVRGHVGLDDVAIRPVDGGAPELSLGRLDAEIDWSGLLERTVHVTELTLIEPQVGTERRAGGTFVVPGLYEPPPTDEPADDVEALVGPPSPEPEPTEPEAAADAEAQTPWTVLIDRVLLTDAKLSFLDQTVAADGLALRMPRLEAQNITIGSRGDPIVVAMLGRLDDGEIEIDATIDEREGGVAITVDIEAKALPLEHSTPYVADLGWRALSGALDATVHYASEPAGVRSLGGTVTVRELAVLVPDLDRPALTLAAATVPVEQVDFTSFSVTIGPIALERPRLVVRPDAPVVLPLVPPGPERDDDEPGDPWTWTIAKVTVNDGTIDLERGETRTPIGLAGTASALPGGTDGFPLTLAASHGGVTIDATGRVVLDPFSLHTDLTTDGAPLAELLDLAMVETPYAVSAGTVSGSVALDLGAAAGDDAALALAGTVTLDALAVTGAEDAFALSAKTTEAVIERVRVGADDAQPGIEVRLARLAVTAPSMKLTRGADGWVLPTSEPDAPDAPASDDGAGPAILIAAVAIDDGRVEIVDRTLRPRFNEEFRDLGVRAERVQLPGLRVAALHAEVHTPTRGTIDVSGRIGRNETQLEMKTRDVAIAPYNGHLSELAGYRAGKGSRATITSRIELEPERYRVASHLVLGDLSLKGEKGEARFQAQTGMPLSVALALLRDAKGNVVLDVPIEGERGAARVALLPVLGSALRQAMLAALASPLKLLGSVVPKGGGRFEADLPDVAFRAGTAELHPDADSAVATLATLLAKAPGLRVRLHPIAGQRDRRGLARADLLTALEAPEATGPLLEVDREQRTRLRDFLVRRRDGKDPTLSESDRATLTTLLDAFPVTPEALQSLALARLERLHDVLTTGHDIAETQLVDGDADRPGAGAPAIEVELLVAE